MKDIYKNWNFDEFLNFIMYYAAMADYNVTPEEKDLIVRHLGNDKYNEVKVFHSQNSDYDNIRAIYYFKEKFCSDQANLQKVYSVVAEVFDADGVYNFYERNMKRALDMLLSE
jgi:hypothetical protein